MFFRPRRNPDIGEMGYVELRPMSGYRRKRSEAIRAIDSTRVVQIAPPRSARVAMIMMIGVGPCAKRMAQAPFYGDFENLDASFANRCRL
jgi:hypothetical protein